MEKTSKEKKAKAGTRKKSKVINAVEFAGTVKAFKNLDALSYQKSLRES